ncbi:motilin receptor-like [Haliotis cracherodii]|uniref:motilin receptor-like n=1 Tax=Haliotis cracherodii TaxID=6455 RepID=UPI0039E86E91
MSNTSVVNTTEYIIASYIDLYVPPILVVMGTICNVLVVMVMQSRYFRNVSTSFYMSVNAITDIASLDIALPVHWLYVNYPWIFLRNPEFDDMCKFFNFFGWGSSDFGIILTVAMTTERAIAITFPLQASKWCSRRRARVVIVVLFFVIVVKEVHFLFKSVIVPKDQTDIEEKHGKYADLAFEMSRLHPKYQVVRLSIVLGA